MHQQAILVTGNAKLGSAGTSVGIDDIEKHYTTTSAANAGIAYKCADPKCGVPVIAVITKLTKAKRKNSPSSYFRANRSKPHVNGCTREPSPPVPTTPSHGGPGSPASPNRTSAPAVWVNPLSRLAVHQEVAVSAVQQEHHQVGHMAQEELVARGRAKAAHRRWRALRRSGLR